MDNTPTTVTYNTQYLRKPDGILRMCELVFALGGLISASIHCLYYYGPLTFFLVLTITSIIRASIVLSIIIFKLEPKLAIYNISIPHTLLINDGLNLILYFISSILVMLSIGICYAVTASIFTTLFSIAMFLNLVGLVYLDYIWFTEERINKQPTIGNNGTTLTESSPTVVPLS